MITCPNCMGAGCIHCREKRLEQERANFQTRARVRQRTDAERTELGLLSRHFGRPSPARRRNEVPDVPANIAALGLLPLRKEQRAARQLGNSVLPAGFAL